MNKYKDLAKNILSLEEYEIDYNALPLKLKDSIKVSDLFYEYFFNDYEIYNINNKLYFNKDDKLKDYNGACKNKECISGKINLITIFTPEIENVKNIVTITHEKAHAYNFFNQKKTSEVIPSFMDIMQSITLNNITEGIKKDNINYKINQAKIAAKIYLKKSKIFYSDEALVNQINYMNDFLKMNLLLEAYYKDPITIKKIIYENLFTSKDDIFTKETYIDDKSMLNKLEFIRKI